MANTSPGPRRVGAGIVMALGALTLLSGLLINPAVQRLLSHARAIDFADPLGSYFGWSLFLGATLLALGFRLARGPSRVDDFALLVIMVCGVILLDRYLLTRFGLTLWTYDTELHYRHRPNVVRTLAGFGRPDSHIVINRWGFHDTEFPLQKPRGEFRALAIGDSITMGYGLTYAETYSAHLERLLGRSDRRHASHQVINAGVHGYSTFHQRTVLQRALVFAPDVVFVGFCMNDVTEPFVVDERLGGTGFDYHGVTQVANPLGGWLANETGFGRLVQSFAVRGKNPQFEKRAEVYNVRRMAAESRSLPALREAWRIVLEQMSEIYALGRKHGVPVVLVIFPYTFQLADLGLRAPQEILAQHAAAQGVDVIDTTDDFASAVFDDPGLVDYLRRKGKTADEVLAYHRVRTERYFFDDNHFTEAGHRIVAQRLLEYLLRKGLVGDSGERGGG